MTTTQCHSFADDSVYLFTVNHPQHKSQVEIFRFVEEDTLIHLKSITHPLLYRYVLYNKPYTVLPFFSLDDPCMICISLIYHLFQCEWHCCGRSRELLRHKWSLFYQWCTTLSDYHAGSILVWSGVLQSRGSEGGSRWLSVLKWHQHITWQTVSSYQQSLMMCKAYFF